MTQDDRSTRPLVLVTGADENYSIGLAVTIRSMLHHLGADRQVQLHVLDGGFTPQTKSKLLKSWQDSRMQVVWHDVDMDELSHLVIAGHLNHSTYLRLLIPSIVSQDVEKVIYLDADLLLRRDLGLLWDEPLGDHSVLAAQETSTPYIDSTVVYAEAPLKYSKLGTCSPIANYRELGMDPHARVFNAGVLVINVAQWRKQNIPQKVYECLETHREHVLFCDQYALNVVLHHQWRELDSRWNQNSHFYTYKTCECSPLDEKTFDELNRDPWICHFTWIHKPWFNECNHPFAGEYVAQMKRTAWSSHRMLPNPALAVRTQPRRTFKQWMERRRVRIQKRLERFGIRPPQKEDGRRAA